MTESSDEFRLNMVFDPDWLPALDDWRKRQPDLPTRPEAIRRIVAAEIGIKSSGAEKPASKGRKKP